MLSITTDTGRMAAVRVLSATQSAAQDILRRITTGQTVSSAKDDGAAFAIAQNTRGDIASYEALDAARERTLGLLDTTMTGLASISDLVIQLKKLATAASDTSLDDASRAALDHQYQAMLGDIDNISTSSSYGGNNLLDSNGSNFVRYGAGALPPGTPPVSWSGGLTTGEPQPGDSLTLSYGFRGDGNQSEKVSGLLDFKLRYFDGTAWTVLPLGATVTVPDTTTVTPGGAPAVFSQTATMPSLPANATQVQTYAVFRGQIPYPDGATVDESAGQPSHYPTAPSTPALLASWNFHDWQAASGSQNYGTGYTITPAPPTASSTEAGQSVSGAISLASPDPGFTTASVDYSVSYTVGDTPPGTRSVVTTTATQNIAASSPPAASLSLPYALTIPSGAEGHNTAALVANVTIIHDVPPHGQSDSSTAAASSVTASGSLAGQPHITIANAIAQGKSFSYAVRDAAATGLEVDQTTATPTFQWYDGSSWNSSVLASASVSGQALTGSFVLPAVAGPILKARIVVDVDVTSTDPLDPLATPTLDSHSLTLLDWDSTALVAQSSSTEFAANATVVSQERATHTVEKNAKLQTLDTISGDQAVIREANMTTAGTKGLQLYGSSLADHSAAMDAIARLAHAQTLVQNAAQYYSEKSHRFETMQRNDTVFANAYKSAVGRLTDADMAKEAAALAAIQAKGQLAAQSLAIANAAPQMLLSLFR